MKTPPPLITTTMTTTASTTTPISSQYLSSLLFNLLLFLFTTPLLFLVSFISHREDNEQLEFDALEQLENPDLHVAALDLLCILFKSRVAPQIFWIGGNILWWFFKFMKDLCVCLGQGNKDAI